MEEELLLLKLIKTNGKIENLTKRGYEYSQIAKLVSDFMQKGYISINAGNITLTDIGEKQLYKLNGKLNKKHSERFISPQKEYMIEDRKNINDIYLPDDF